MSKIRVAYICLISNELVRKHLLLRKNFFRNIILRIFHKPINTYSDYAIWNSDFINEFKFLNDYEFHIVSPHNGMIKKRTDFVEEGINYHFFKGDSNLLVEAYRSYSHQNQRTDYRRIRSEIMKIIKEIDPTVVIVCGAEQPSFSPCIWDLKEIPTLVLLETCVNDPLLMQSLKGAQIYGAVEKRSFEEMSYFATASLKYYQIVRGFNKSAKCVSVGFPSHLPPVLEAPVKKFDFLFYSAVLSKNKGVEDVINAFNKVILKHNVATLNICGRCDASYMEYLRSLISKEAINNVFFTGYFETVDEKLSFVQSARNIVLPGITAPLNSTVRESMLMGLPTIVYATEATARINEKRPCLLCADMSNVKDLSDKMLYALAYPQEMTKLAINAKEYALVNFSNKTKAQQLLKAAMAIIKDAKSGDYISKDQINRL